MKTTALVFVLVALRQTEAAATITAAAASTVTPKTGQDLFPYETVQLTESNLNPLNASLISLFGFDDVAGANITARNQPKCKTFPGDPLWPQEWVWSIFNVLLGGSLLKTVPIAAPCYSGPHYDLDRCTIVVNNWTDSALHELDPTSIMFPLYQGNTCPPTLTPTSECTLGGYPSYAVKATNTAQIQLAVNFARSTNIRLVVKNTGHDFSGKSGGAGALSVWTHNLKDIKYIPKYTDKASGWSGPAFKAGSGVIAKDIYAAANERGLTVIGGEGQTVGVMGGYIQGGGHSPLSSIYGIAADHVLAMEVVTADGRYVTASSSSNSDLFWALRGGGGATFGVVTSITIRAYPKISATVVSFSFISATMSTDTFWAGVRTYFDYFLDFADKGTYSYFFIYPFGIMQFIMQPFFAPNMNIAETQALLKPWFDRLAALGINISPVYSTHDNFYDAWIAGFPLETVGRNGQITGSRLFQRSAWEDPAQLNATFEAWASSARDSGALLINFNMAPKNFVGADNAVNPAWRNAVMHAIQGSNVNTSGTADEAKAVRSLVTDLQTKWIAVSPGAGAYLGESDPEEVNFQQSFWGSNYARLSEIKAAVDPKNVFWVRTGVKSEIMKVDSSDAIQDENGPLCYV
ncbi:hypothetical protein BP6252_08900 [Coleophoma cylindrospora]|uniref:FAD-binding PCMH-type domain-containing protein n=1 Tax=Coleophoma cylindrospora TaxID=1849047 RepID=A0A3D8R0Z3_9HELO|nr:hypothetical protein BP6252_08900 [Coleophoma cylindrospora]